ncbi:TetR/AcrR family transcriptional regulator [Embleya scabrispora]|uniref:TetR/AcrR family transcriptional regulator n=1 Tax=Embleya scabrispora TaxID=159449 RepID=UPI0003704201|nr:TetR/AcrR family transcriptional regulator [Embleya scabrispora]MYS83562.1 TetR family transcriptional regulator [Streptomyces sp. SID5474]
MAREKSGRADPARTLALLWRTGEGPTRGPKQGLTVDRIALAAIGIADADGLGALSMRAVAERLGVGTMSLYTYVPGKAELLHVMFDTVLGENELPDAAGLGWRAALERHARADHALAQRHPWVVQLWGPGLLLMGPRITARAESALRTVAELGLTEAEMAHVVGLVDAYVRGVTQVAVDVNRDAVSSGVGYEDWWAESTPYLERLIQPARFPTLTRVWAAGTYEEAPDAGFEFGLRLVLDGIETLIRSRRPAEPVAAAEPPATQE